MPPTEPKAERKPGDIKRAQTVPSAADSAVASAKAAHKQIDAAKRRTKESR